MFPKSAFYVARIIAWVLAFGCASTAAAQTSDDPVANARFRVGPLGVTPSGALTNFGIDSNVFNEATDPKSDFTFSVSPRLDTWLRAGRARLAVFGRADLNYYRRYASERSVDGEFGARLSLPGNRIRPWAEGSRSRGRQRMGYEIDHRSLRDTVSLGFGSDWRIGSKTALEASAQRRDYRFDTEEFLGTSLRETLNRTAESLAVGYRYSPTVYTTVVVRAEALRDRFRFSPGRDTNGVRLLGGLDFDERALISGSIRVGYRRFVSIGGALPNYSGPVASAETGMVLGGRARLDIEANRDVEYSFERVFPYYIITGGLATLTPRLTEQWDVQGRFGGQRLAYRTSGNVGTARLDRHVTIGLGVGYHLGPDLRIGLNVDHLTRRSPLAFREYKGIRIGSSVTYGR